MKPFACAAMCALAWVACAHVVHAAAVHLDSRPYQQQPLTPRPPVELQDEMAMIPSLGPAAARYNMLGEEVIGIDAGRDPIDVAAPAVGNTEILKTGPSEYTIKVPMPGLKKDEIMVDVTGDTVHVRGRHVCTYEELHHGKRPCVEVQYEQYLTLPEGVAVEEKARAEMQGSTLVITVPITNKKVNCGH